MQKSTKRWALGALLAGLAGFIAGILTAPKSGKETREDIKQAAQTGMAEAEKQLKKLHTQMVTVLDEAKTKVKTLKGKAQSDLEMAIEKTSVVREKARELLSALHEGDADDKELKKAIADANNSIEHLRNYLKKS